jgi:uncharacterized membrane protein YkvA (DUF1232 family)
MNVNEILNSFTAEAKNFISNPAQLDGLLAQAEDKLRAIPGIGETVSGLPVLISMVKSWISKEYEVQPKVLVTIVASLLYLLKGKDIISDKIPVIGMADDVAVLGFALKLIEPELNAYKAWREQAPQAQAPQAQAPQAQGAEQIVTD